MSMTTRSNNVVPFDTTTPAPTPSPWPPGPWPMANVMPGCAPPGAMDGLMGCYYSVQAATAFISAIMIDAINNNPAVVQAIIAAIEKSGSNLPLIGVTNGADAQPGQVGEFVSMVHTLVYQVGTTTQSVSVGVLQPGDWDVQAYAWPESTVTLVQFGLNPVPVGFSDAMSMALTDAGSQVGVVLASYQTRALLSVPTLIPMSVTVTSTAASNLILTVTARRRR